MPKKSILAQIIMACPVCGATGSVHCTCNVPKKLMTKAKAADLAVLYFARQLWPKEF